MKVTERDIKIIQFINEFGFCDITQLRALFGLKKTWMYDIMKRLVDAGLINHKYILHARHGAYFASRKGAQYTDLPPIDHIYLGQYEHQISIIKVYIKLRQHYPMAYWISERKLKHDKFFDGVGKFGHIADGILVFPDGKQIAIEVEMTVKGKNRINKILRGYSAQFAINEIWYYCAPGVIPILTAAATDMPFVKIYNLENFLL